MRAAVLALISLLIAVSAPPVAAGALPASMALTDVPAAPGAWRGGGLHLVAESKPLGAVLRAIGARYPGHALDARRVERDGRPLYRIKWLGDDGKVREITADAATGEILSVR